MSADDDFQLIKMIRECAVCGRTRKILRCKIFVPNVAESQRLSDICLSDIVAQPHQKVILSDLGNKNFGR